MAGGERSPDVLEGIDIRPYAAPNRAGLIALWRACALTRPWNDVGQDIERCLQTPASTLLVAVRGADDVVGSVMLGSDGHRGWLYYLAVDPQLQRRGLGRRLVRAAEDWLATRGVGKVMLMLRRDNDATAFYEALGYAEEQRVLMAHWLRAPARGAENDTMD